MDEYIYKDEAFAIIENKQREICPMGRYSRAAVYGSDREAFDNWQEILDEIKAIPSADVVSVRHGRWETNSDRPDSLICSVCKCGFDMWKHEPHNYCPNCGAKMDGGSD